MQPPQHTRINLADLKAQIVKKLGLEGSKQYFFYLNRFLSLKLSKVEFNNLCLRIIGRENIQLHNQFIHSLLRNACTAKVPPQVSERDNVLKHCTQVGGEDIPAESYQQNGSLSSMTQTIGSLGLSNGGDISPVLPHKARTGFRDQRIGERRSALGPNGKTSVAPQLSTAARSSDYNVTLENGDLNPIDVGRPLHHHHHILVHKQTENESEILVLNPAKMSVGRRSLDDSVPVHGKNQTDLGGGDDEKEGSARSPLQAPLGVPLCPVSIGGARRALPQTNSSRCIGTFNNGVLLDSLTVRERMEQIAVSQGLGGVSMDCANVLNHGLDSYVKVLIRSCIELVAARSGHVLIKNNNHKKQPSMKLINGIKPGHQYQMQSSGGLLEVQQRTHYPISLQDFRVAMELNPRQLGEDWPLLLEKICTHAFEE